MKNNIEDFAQLKDRAIFKCKQKNDYYDFAEQRATKFNKDTIFVYAPKSRKYGNYFSLENFVKNFDFEIKTEEEQQKSKTEQWHKRLKRAIKCLGKSGLWKNIKEIFNNLLTITYEEKEEITKEYWATDRYGKDKTEYNNFIAKIKAKHPFMIGTNDMGQEFVKTDYIYELSECILKSMYFGKWHNEQEKETIKQRLADKQDYKTWARTNYDTSFEYVAEKNMAWYSEEYKNCGNGHYYLALDESTALFCEND